MADTLFAIPRGKYPPGFERWWTAYMDGYRWYSSLAACEVAKEQAKPRQ